MGKAPADFWAMQPYEIWWLVGSATQKKESDTDWDELYNQFHSAKKHG